MQKDTLLKILDPDLLKNNLINISMFILTYEIFKNSLINNLRTFYCLGYEKETDNYKTKVRKLDSNGKNDIFRGSLEWYKNNKILTQHDIVSLEKITKHRNDIVHELAKYIGTIDNNLNVELYHNMCDLICKIDKWWILNYEIPCNSDFDGKKIDEDDIHSGNMLFLNLILNILEGGDDYIEKLRKALKENNNKEGRK